VLSVAKKLEDNRIETYKTDIAAVVDAIFIGFLCLCQLQQTKTHTNYID
jgi:hypothetical protein